MKSKKAFVLGAAMMAASFVSAFALAEQYPSTVSPQAVTPASGFDLKPGGTLQAQPLSEELAKKFKDALAAGTTPVLKPATSKAGITETVVSEPKKPSQGKLKAAAADFVPLFPTLDINTLYTISEVQTGQEFPYHFNLPHSARVLVQLIGQSAGADMSLSLFRDDGQGGDPVLLATSDNPSNADEYISGILPAGDYYWYMVANTANNAQFSFGVAADTNVDAYEPNDTAQTAFVLPDALNQVVGNLDNANDVDYFDFKSVRGQNVALALKEDREGTRNQWILDRFDGSNWVAVPAGTSVSLSGAAGFTAKVRVRANTAVAQDPTAHYKLTLGSFPRLNSNSVTGDNIVRIPFSMSSTATQTARLLNWSTQWSDTTGVPLPGITPVLRVDKRFYDINYHWVDYKATTNSAGASSATATLGTCNGDYRAIFNDSSTGVSYKWDTTFNEGGWRIELDEFPGVGVGGSNVQYVSLGHICTQTIVH